MNTLDTETSELTSEALNAAAGGSWSRPIASFKVLGVRFEFWPDDGVTEGATATWWDGREITHLWRT